jgi:hypothetical protein
MNHGEHGFMYCFPTQDPDPVTGMHFPDDRTGNCATFPQLAFGVDIPDNGGNLREYMPHVTEEAEAHNWEKLRLAATGDLVESEKQQARDLRHTVLYARSQSDVAIDTEDVDISMQEKQEESENKEEKEGGGPCVLL